MIQIPYREILLDPQGLTTKAWTDFFRAILDALGIEKTIALANNQATPVDLTGMRFNSLLTSRVEVSYLIHRITTGGGATELVESGIFHAVYKPISATWELVFIGTPGPDAAGITLSIDADGQVQYESTNITGTESISKITYKAQSMDAKHYSFSRVGVVR